MQLEGWRWRLWRSFVWGTWNQPMWNRFIFYWRAFFCLSRVSQWTVDGRSVRCVGTIWNLKYRNIEISSPSLQQHSAGSVDRSVGRLIVRSFQLVWPFEQSYSRKIIDEVSNHKAESHQLDAVVVADSRYLNFYSLPCLAAACVLRLLCCLHARWSLVVGCWADHLVFNHIDTAIHHCYGWGQHWLPSLSLNPALGSLVDMRDYSQGRLLEPIRYLEKSMNALFNDIQNLRTASFYDMSLRTRITSPSNYPQCIMIGVSISWISLHFRWQCCLRNPCSGRG